MEKRILLGAIAALAVMLGFEALVTISGHPLDLPVDTGWGHVPVVGLGVTLLAMALGGWIAREGFRLPAVLLAAAIAACVAVSLQLSAALSPGPAVFGLAEILRYNALATGLSLLAAWLGASLGQWAAAKWSPMRLPGRSAGA